MRRPPVVMGGGRLADGVGRASAAACWAAWRASAGRSRSSGSQLRGWTTLAQRGVNQPYNMSVLALSLVSAAVAGFLDRTFLIWAAICLPVTLIGAQHRPAALRPHQRRAVPPHRARAARPVRPDADRVLAGVKQVVGARHRNGAHALPDRERPARSCS